MDGLGVPPFQETSIYIYIKYKIDVIICYPLNLGTGKQPNHAYSLVIKHGLLKRTI